MTGGTEEGLDNDLVRETIERTGAFIMGKRMFGEGEANWPEDLYKAPVYVLTNEKRAFYQINLNRSNRYVNIISIQKFYK